jgi:hypothetical protein
LLKRATEQSEEIAANLAAAEALAEVTARDFQATAAAEAASDVPPVEKWEVAVMALLLLQHGADFSTKDARGSTPLLPSSRRCSRCCTSSVLM